MECRSFVLPVLLVAVSSTVFADATVEKAPVPEWVEDLQLQQFSSDRSGAIQYGLAYLLSDRQVRKTSDGFEYANRMAYEVTDRSGLESAAQITHVFDPSNETAFFNFVRILRDGEEFDRLAEAEITILRQEEDMDNSLLDGRMTALIQLQDIRVGDVIDFAISGSVTNKLWPDDFFDLFHIQWPVPIAQLHFNLLLPTEIPITTRSIATNINPEVTQKNSWTSYKLHVFDPEPVREERNTPHDWIPYGFVAFTTMSTWADVVDWAVPLYSVDNSLPQSFTDKLDKIAAKHKNVRDQAVHALRLVQEDIRYLGIEIALGSHVPRPPGVTLERGYGDCKDKSVLLVAALRHLGIKATPALASMSSGDLLPDLPPSIGNFDHVIVGLQLDSETLWVDPTLSHQGGLADNLVELDYGYVLPVQSGQTELVTLNKQVQETPTYEVLETFELPATGDVGLKLSFEYRFRGGMANVARMRLVGQGQDEVSRGFLDYYAANYHGIVELDPFVIDEDLDANTVVYRGSYSMAADTFRENSFHEELPVFATAVQDEIPRLVEANRSAPLRVPYGINYRHVIRVVTPGREFDLPEDKSKTVDGISYTRSFENEVDAFVLDYSLVVANEVINGESLRAVLDLGDEIAEDTELTVFVQSATPTASKSLDLGIPLNPATESAIARISKQVDDENFVGALTGLNVLLRKHPESSPVRGFLQHKRALVLEKLGRRKAAIKAFAEAFELSLPPTEDSYFKYMNMLRKDDDIGGIVPVFVQMLEQQPGTVDRLNMDWVSRWHRDLWRADRRGEVETLVLALAHAVDETDVDDEEEFRWVFRNAIYALVRRDDIDLATAYLPYLKHPNSFAELLTNKETAAIWDAVESFAGEDLSTAIANYVSYTYLAANLSPDDYTTHTQRILALRIAGRDQEAVRYADLYRNDWPRIEAVGEDAFWFINETAYALYAAGDGQQAMQLLDELLGLGIVENNSLISMGINRAQLLLHSGRFTEALAAVEELESLGEDYANDYGRMWIYDVKACSLHQLGREEDARAVYRDSITPIADENPGALTKTLLCLDDYDEAATNVIERLEDEDENTSLIVSFSKIVEPTNEPPFLTELNRRANEINRRDDVQAAFQKVGRKITINGTSDYWGSF